MACVNALLLGSLLYRSGLVPRIIPLVGLIGAPLLFASDLAVMFGFWAQGLVAGGDGRRPDRAVGGLPRHLSGRRRLQALTDQGGYDRRPTPGPPPTSKTPEGLTAEDHGRASSGPVVVQHEDHLFSPRGTTT